MEDVKYISYENAGELLSEAEKMARYLSVIISCETGRRASELGLEGSDKATFTTLVFELIMDVPLTENWNDDPN